MRRIITYAIDPDTGQVFSRVGSEMAIPILDWINENLKTPLTNIMGQYHPDYRILRGENPEINRRPSTLEMFDVRKHADDLGLYWKSVS